MSQPYESHYVDVNSTRTHYLEAGVEHDETVVLLHSGEFGATAELSWEKTIGPLADDYHVVAPDMLGYGFTEKIFSFDDQFDRRVRHIANFLDTLCIDDTHFIGHSMGAGYIASHACEDDPDWTMNKLVLISGGGGAPEGFGEILHNFDASEESVRNILDLLFYEERSDAYVERKQEASKIPGHWQCTAAIRFDPPFEQDTDFRRQHDYEHIDRPTLLIGGKEDPLKPADVMQDLRDTIPNSELELFEECHHSAQLEHPDEFLERAKEFLAD